MGSILVILFLFLLLFVYSASIGLVAWLLVKGVFMISGYSLSFWGVFLIILALHLIMVLVGKRSHQ